MYLIYLLQHTLVTYSVCRLIITPLVIIFEAYALRFNTVRVYFFELIVHFFEKELLK